MNPVRYAIVGVGGFGQRRRETLRATGEFEIIGGMDVRPEIFEQAGKEEGRSLVQFSSIEELVDDSRVEAVFISTPAHLHLGQAMMAAAAGRAIFVEKPLGHDLAACEKLVAYCEEKRIPHGHGFTVRFEPVWQYVKQMVDEGKLGRIVSVSGATMHTGGLASSSGNWRFVADRNPGGPLFQCGIHKIDLLRFLFGEGKWLAAYVNRTITDSPTDDSYVLLGTFGGLPCTLHSHYVASYRHALEIYGTKGNLFITEFPVKLEHKITELDPFREELRDVTSQIPQTDAMSESLRDFARAVREKRQPLMNGRDGLDSLRLIFEATRIATELPVH